MQVIGFNFTKIHAEKSPDFSNAGRNYDIEFLDLKREELDLLKEAEAINLSFRYTLSYGDAEKLKDNKNEKKDAEVYFEGKIKISASKKEAEDFQESWKKKQVPQSSAFNIHNFILKRCTIKSVSLHDDIGLPDPHLRIPQLQTEKKED
jgi:hypothetical protein